MDFFASQDQARRQTRLLVVAFALAVVVVVAITNLLFAVLFCLFQNINPWNPSDYLRKALILFGEALVYPRHFFALIWNPLLFINCTACVLLSVSAGCFYKLRRLARGGTVVAEMLGGRRIHEQPAGPAERQLRQVIEEMAVASLLPVPEIYVLDRERGINAFAAGHARDDIAVGVTSGALQLLTRDELQGLVAHEFSHILNGDTRFNMRLIAVAHGLFWPTLLGRFLLRGSTKAPEMGESIFDQEAAPAYALTAPLGFVFLFVGSISLPFVRVIKSAICREREWLADAAAVQFTRNPAGIAGALKKLGGYLKQGRLDTPYAEMASHLYFANSTLDPWFDFMSTHPPVAKRVLALDPDFDGHFQHIKSLPRPEVAQAAAYDRLYAENVQRAQAEAKAREQFE